MSEKSSNFVTTLCVYVHEREKQTEHETIHHNHQFSWIEEGKHI